MPKISLVFINYNKEKYLVDALSSVQAQTFRDWECIVVDDGSTDNSRIIIKKFCKSDPRFRIIRRENGGPCVARNTGMAAAVGEFIMFMDSDDIMAADAMESLLATRERYPADVIYGTCRYIPDGYTSQQPIPAHPGIPAFAPLFIGGRGDFDKLMDIDSRIFRFSWCWLCLFPRPLLAGLLWDAKIFRNNDTAFIVDVLARATRVVVADVLVSLHRDSVSSLSHETFGEQTVQYLPALLKHVASPLRVIGGKFERRFYHQAMQWLFRNNIVAPVRAGRFRKESADAMLEIYGTPALPLEYLPLWKRIFLRMFIRAATLGIF